MERERSVDTPACWQFAEDLREIPTLTVRGMGRLPCCHRLTRPKTKTAPPVKARLEGLRRTFREC
jgi:hypothetical protein